MTQCTAEAQEVTVARAIELKHNAALISALAHETSKLFTEAADLLGPINEKLAGQWKKYLQLKAAFYMSYAYNYCGENELTLDKCGDAIRALQESEKYYAKAEALCKDYSKTKGFAKYAHPEKHLYHQKVPYDPPQLELKATYGLKAAVKAEGDLPPVKEATIHQSETDPKNSSGCSIQ
ncbi:hypothetical protein B566_EDAN007875 [Ephemera danica]|nr:hypothetical protein B566_EDAN007875 [Ephemera danica]